MEILMLREHRECIKRAAAWFHAKWGVPQEAYEESMLACLEKNTTIPQWRKHGGIKELPVNCFNLYVMIWRNGISIPCIC